MISFRHIIFILLVTTILYSCKTNESEMRRFSFVNYNSLSDTVAFKNIASNQSLNDILKHAGVVNYSYCTLDSTSFLILDMKSDFNLDKTKEIFKSLSQNHNELETLSSIISGKYHRINRIYKMDQKYEYSYEEGQLIPMQKENIARFILTLEIINDPILAKEYVAVHAIGKAWPEISQNMKTVGIHEMELYKTGYRAFLIMDTKPTFDWDTDGKTWGELPREKEWQAHVAKFQKTDPESNAAEKWIGMNVISMN